MRKTPPSHFFGSTELATSRGELKEKSLESWQPPKVNLKRSSTELATSKGELKEKPLESWHPPEVNLKRSHRGA